MVIEIDIAKNFKRLWTLFVWTVVISAPIVLILSATINPWGYSYTIVECQTEGDLHKVEAKGTPNLFSSIFDDSSITTKYIVSDDGDFWNPGKVEYLGNINDDSLKTLSHLDRLSFWESWDVFRKNKEAQEIQKTFYGN